MALFAAGYAGSTAVLNFRTGPVLCGCLRPHGICGFHEHLLCCHWW